MQINPHPRHWRAIAMAATLALLPCAHADDLAVVPAHNLSDKIQTESRSAQALALETAEPIAIVPADAKSTDWPNELREIVTRLSNKLRLDDSSVIKLRSLVPDGGSIEFGIGLAEKAVRRVRDELMALGVKARQIKTMVSHESSDSQKNSEPRGVELYLEAQKR